MDEENFEDLKDGKYLADLAEREVAAAIDVDVVDDTFDIFHELVLHKLVRLARDLGLLALHLLFEVDGEDLRSVSSLALHMLLVKSVADLLALGLAHPVAGVMVAARGQALLRLNSLLVHGVRVESAINTV